MMPTASSVDELTEADYVALAAFRHGMRRYLAFAEQGAKSVGLTAKQHQALLVVRAHRAAEPLSIGDLADQLLIKNHSAVELVARLVKADLVRRDQAVDDKRKVVLQLTPKGENVLAALSRNNLRELNLIAPAFTGMLRRLEKAAR
jgi:DNA-binding MarR family transcriptional regulator